MTLWAFRVAILGPGPWLLVSSEKNMERLQNSPRRRKPATIPDWVFEQSLF